MLARLSATPVPRSQVADSDAAAVSLVIRTANFCMLKLWREAPKATPPPPPPLDTPLETTQKKQHRSVSAAILTVPYNITLTSPAIK